MMKMFSNPWFVEGMEDIAQEALQKSQQRPQYLSLNATNPLIQKLADLIDRHGEVAQEVMLGIYTSTFLYSQNLITLSNVEIIHGQFVRLLEKLTLSQETLRNLQRDVEEARRQSLELRQHQAQMAAGRPDHILLFMITPFSDDYKPLEEAVRRVFENSPYCFEVRLARDYTHATGLLANVRAHMLQAHGFIAEISDLNANVMFELGAVMLADDQRPVFSLRSRDSQKDVPADLKHELYIPYSSLQQPVESLEQEVRSALERDGRIIHNHIEKLLPLRKRRFLSRTVLEKTSLRLTTEQLTKFLQHYTTLEDLFSASPQKIAAQLSLNEHAIAFLQQELKEA